MRVHEIARQYEQSGGWNPPTCCHPRLCRTCTTLKNHSYRPTHFALEIGRVPIASCTRAPPKLGAPIGHPSVCKDMEMHDHHYDRPKIPFPFENEHEVMYQVDLTRSHSFWWAQKKHWQHVERMDRRLVACSQGLQRLASTKEKNM